MKLLIGFANLLLFEDLSAIARPTGCRAVFVRDSPALEKPSNVKRRGFVWEQDEFTYITAGGYRETSTSGPTQLRVDEAGRATSVCFWKDYCYEASSISLQGCKLRRADSEMYYINPD
jgi:hypothetical protein